MAAIYGTGVAGRWCGIAEPKGEYVAPAARLGLEVVRLSPGGSSRLNPLEDGPGVAGEAEERRTLRRAEMVAALSATVLDRSLTQLEDVAIFTTVEHLGRRCRGATLADL